LDEAPQAIPSPTRGLVDHSDTLHTGGVTPAEKPQNGGCWQAQKKQSLLVRMIRLHKKKVAAFASASATDSSVSLPHNFIFFFFQMIERDLCSRRVPFP
jgi:hypothetical protein